MSLFDTQLFYGLFSILSLREVLRLKDDVPARRSALRHAGVAISVGAGQRFPRHSSGRGEALKKARNDEQPKANKTYFHNVILRLDPIIQTPHPLDSSFRWNDSKKSGSDKEIRMLSYERGEALSKKDSPFRLYNEEGETGDRV